MCEFPRVAVAAICRRPNRQVLMLQKMTGSEPYHWEFPGGKLEEGEDLKAAALRELQEETGVIAESPKIVGVINEIKEDYHWVTVMIACQWLAGSPQIMEPGKFCNIGWFDLRDLPEPTRGTVPVFLHEFRTTLVQASGIPLL